MSTLFEVVVETFDSDGTVTHTELIRRHTLLSEAQHTKANTERAMNPERLGKTHRCVIRETRT